MVGREAVDVELMGHSCVASARGIRTAEFREAVLRTNMKAALDTDSTSKVQHCHSQ